MASDITRWDMQMGFEQMLTVLMPDLAVPDSISGLGRGWDGASSLEMMVINNEVFNDVARIVRGISVDEGGLAIDLIDKVGHMGNFLAEPHTMDNLRKGELRVSPLWDKRGSDRVAKEGSKPIQDTAKDHVRRILEEHIVMPLEKNVEMELDKVVKEESKKLLAKY